MKPNNPLIKAFAAMFIGGLLVVLLVPFATRSSYAGGQIRALQPGDQLTVTCPTSFKHRVADKKIRLNCRTGEGDTAPPPASQTEPSAQVVALAPGDRLTVRCPTMLDHTMQDYAVTLFCRPEQDEAAEGQNPPADGQAPAEGQNPPADGQAPAEGQNPPADGQAPAEGQNPPADGQAPADEAAVELANDTGPDIGASSEPVPIDPHADMAPQAMDASQASLTAAASASPTDCSGYAEQRYFLDSQAWWLTTPGKNGPNHGHVHAATCFPLAQTVKGTIPFDIRLTMHDNPGKLTSLTIQIGESGSYVAARKTFKPPLTCTMTCSWWVHLEANTAGFPNDGWQEIRIRPKVDEPDGKTMIGSTSYQVYLANGKPRKDYRPPNFIQGKGWYTDVNYAQARMTAGFPFNRTVSGTWSVTVGCDSSKLKVTGCLVTLDPDFHAGNQGTVLKQTSGGWSGSLTIDTRKLPNGPHKLVIRSDVDAPTGSTNSGLLAIPFMVQN